jgi:hypothetical protein
VPKDGPKPKPDLERKNNKKEEPQKEAQKEAIPKDPEQKDKQSEQKEPVKEPEPEKEQQKPEPEKQRRSLEDLYAAAREEFDLDLSPMESAIKTLKEGREMQKLSVVRNLGDLFETDTNETMQKVIPMIQARKEGIPLLPSLISQSLSIYMFKDLLNVEPSNLDMHCEAAVVYKNSIKDIKLQKHCPYVGNDSALNWVDLHTFLGTFLSGCWPQSWRILSGRRRMVSCAGKGVLLSSKLPRNSNPKSKPKWGSSPMPLNLHKYLE